MKSTIRYSCILTIAIMLVGFPLWAQYTQVTAQVQDNNGSLYANCTYSVSFVGQSSSPGPYLLGGNPSGFFQQIFNGLRCDSSGNLALSLPDNVNTIQPTPSQWKFSICSASGYLAGPYCFTKLETITGASQVITADLKAVAPILPVPTVLNKLRSCQTGIGDGLNAIPAGTYLESFCFNDTGATWTITGIKCFSDNAGTSTMNATNGAGTGLLTGAVTCTSAFAAGTQSATTTIGAGDFIKFTFVSDAATKQTTWVVSLQ